MLYVFTGQTIFPDRSTLAALPDSTVEQYAAPLEEYVPTTEQARQPDIDDAPVAEKVPETQLTHAVGLVTDE